MEKKMKKETETRLTREQCLTLFDMENNPFTSKIIKAVDENYYFFSGKIWELIDERNLKIKIKHEIGKKLPTTKYFYSVLVTENFIQNEFLNKIYEADRIEIDKKSERYHVFNNGVLDIMTMTLKPHEDVKNQYLTMKIDLDYIPDAKLGPVADKMLKQLFSDKTEKEIEQIYLNLGYMLNPNKNYDRVIVNYGVGCTGKSTFLKFIEQMAGTSYASTKLKHLASENNRFYFSSLKNKLIVADDDVSTYEWNTNTLKSISGTKALASDVKFSKPIEFKIKFGIILNVNRLPFINDLAPETIRRFFFIRFGITQKRQNTMGMEFQLDVEKENNFSYFLNYYLNNQNKFADMLDELDAKSHSLLRKENVLFSFFNDCFSEDLDNKQKITPQMMCSIYSLYSMNKKMKPHQIWDYFRNDPKLKIYTTNKANHKRFYKLSPNKKYIDQLFMDNGKPVIDNYYSAYADKIITGQQQEPKTEQEPKNEASLF